MLNLLSNANFDDRKHAFAGFILFHAGELRHIKILISFPFARRWLLNFQSDCLWRQTEYHGIFIPLVQISKLSSIKS